MVKQKIIHILYSGLGGTTDYVFNFIKADVNFEYEHVILFYGIEKVPQKQLDLANKLVGRTHFIHKQKGYDRSSASNVLDFIKNESPQFIILNVNSLILTCSKYNQGKLIFVEHQANHLKTKKEWVWSVLAQNKAYKVVSLTDAYYSDLKSKLKFLFVSRKNIVIKTGIVLADFMADKVRNSRVIKIGMISRINGFRDHQTLISAFNQINLENVELHLAGDGPLLKRLQANNQNANIIFHGNIDQELIPNFLHELDIYCHATLGETSSVAIMQAQASKLPLIVSNVNGVRNIMSSDDCVFVEPKISNDYKEALELLINSEVKREEFSKKSFEYANKNLSHIRMFDEYKKLLEE